jgi:hypothetical protein
VCYIELESCEVWDETKRRARKAHRCSCCKGPIAPGDTYLVHFSVYDGAITSDKCCGRCEEARGEFGDAHESMIPTPSYFPYLLADCIAEGDEESETKWRPMLEAILARAA